MKASWDSITSFSYDEAAVEAVCGSDDCVGGCCVYVDVLASSKFAAAALASEVETAISKVKFL